MSEPEPESWLHSQTGGATFPDESCRGGPQTRTAGHAVGVAFNGKDARLPPRAASTTLRVTHTVWAPPGRPPSMGARGARGPQPLLSTHVPSLSASFPSIRSRRRGGPLRPRRPPAAALVPRPPRPSASSQQQLRQQLRPRVSQTLLAPPPFFCAILLPPKSPAPASQADPCQRCRTDSLGPERSRPLCQHVP